VTAKTIEFSPFTRVEGDLRISVEIEDDRVVEAYTSGTLFRGFENILRGRDPKDAIVIVCRICGQCGGAHSRAAATALADAYGIVPPPNGYLAANVIQATEVILNHLTHFYMSFAADLVGPPYGKELARRFTPVTGASYVTALRVRKGLLGILGIFAGKWPNTLALQPGGTTRTVTSHEIVRALGILSDFRDFVENHILRCTLERWFEITGGDELDRWLGEADHATGDLGLFLRTALDHGLHKIGRGPGTFLSSGGWSLGDGKTWLKPGLFNGKTSMFDAAEISEHVRYSWFEPYEGGKHPLDGETQTSSGRPDAYSWCKAPRYAGRPAEVGSLARMVNDCDPLASDLLGAGGPSVYLRVLMRFHEMFRLMEETRVWLDTIEPDEPFYVRDTPKDNAEGVGLAEAARGCLGHWVRIENGTIRNYQIVPPTSWNLSPRDSDDNPGPVEFALVGTPVQQGAEQVNIAHVVRSFDPCLFCCVH